MKKIPPLNNPYSFTDYKNLVIELAENKSCTGELTPERIEATHINAQRIKRIDKQCTINSELSELIQLIPEKQKWVLLLESWCGDGAQCSPVIAKIAELNSHIDLKIILRDENLEIMDAFLTNGSRSIPKLIILQNEVVIDTWGARPKAIQQKVLDFKKANPNATHDEFVKYLHLWYAQDKTNSIQDDFKEIIKKQIKTITL